MTGELESKWAWPFVRALYRWVGECGCWKPKVLTSVLRIMQDNRSYLQVLAVLSGMNFQQQLVRRSNMILKLCFVIHLTPLTVYIHLL